MEATTHHWEKGAQFCSCGQDTVTCQGCGKLTCGNLAIWRDDGIHPSHAGRGGFGGNIGPCCFARFGMGHMGPPVKGTAPDKFIEACEIGNERGAEAVRALLDAARAFEAARLDGGISHADLYAAAWRKHEVAMRLVADVGS